MAYRELFVVEIREVLRLWQAGVDGFPIPPSTGYFRAPPPDQPDLRPRAPAPASEGPPRPAPGVRTERSDGRATGAGLGGRRLSM